MNCDELPIIPVCAPHLAPRRGSCPDLQRVLCRPALNVRVCMWVSLLRCVCSVQVDIVQPTESIKEIMKMCVASLTVVQCWSSEYYGCDYQIAKLTGHVTHHPTQTAHSKQHLIACLTAHHCPLGGIWVTANGLSVIIKVLSQMSRKYTHTESAKH